MVCVMWLCSCCIPCVMFTAMKSVESFPPLDYDKNIVVIFAIFKMFNLNICPLNSYASNVLSELN